MLKEMSYGPRKRESRGVLENNGVWYNIMRSFVEDDEKCGNMLGNCLNYLMMNIWLKGY